MKRSKPGFASALSMWIRSFWYILTLRCEEADRLRSVGDPASLRAHQRIAERIHRGLCKSCRHAAAQLELLDSGLRDLSQAVLKDNAMEEAHPEWSSDRLARLDSVFRDETGGDQSESSK